MEQRSIFVRKIIALVFEKEMRYDVNDRQFERGMDVLKFI